MDRLPSDIVYKIFDSLPDPRDRLSLATTNVAMCVMYNVHRNRAMWPECHTRYQARDEIKRMLSKPDPKGVGQRRMLLGERAFEGRGVDGILIPPFHCKSTLLYLASYKNAIEMVAKLVFDLEVRLIPQYTAVKKHLSALQARFPLREAFFKKILAAKLPNPLTGNGWSIGHNPDYSFFPTTGPMGLVLNEVGKKEGDV